jgi:hypothetical protein
MMDLVMKWKGLASHSLLLLSFILSTLSIPATCNATRVVHQLDQQQMFENYDQEVCPPWFYFNTVTGTCMLGFLRCKVF